MDRHIVWEELHSVYSAGSPKGLVVNKKFTWLLPQVVSIQKDQWKVMISQNHFKDVFGFIGMNDITFFGVWGNLFVPEFKETLVKTDEHRKWISF